MSVISKSHIGFKYRITIWRKWKKDTAFTTYVKSCEWANGTSLDIDEMFADRFDYMNVYLKLFQTPEMKSWIDDFKKGSFDDDAGGLIEKIDGDSCTISVYGLRIFSCDDGMIKVRVRDMNHNYNFTSIHEAAKHGQVSANNHLVDLDFIIDHDTH